MSLNELFHSQIPSSSALVRTSCTCVIDERPIQASKERARRPVGFATTCPRRRDPDCPANRYCRSRMTAVGLGGLFPSTTLLSLLELPFKQSGSRFMCPCMANNSNTLCCFTGAQNACLFSIVPPAPKALANANRTEMLTRKRGRQCCPAMSVCSGCPLGQ